MTTVESNPLRNPVGQVDAVENWPPLDQLPSAVKLVTPMSDDMLPPALGKWLRARATAAGVPLDMVAVCVIASIGAVISARVRLQNAPNAPGVPLNTWAVICGPPSSRKSYCASLGSSLVSRAEAKAAAEYEKKRPTLEAQKTKLEAAVNGIDAQIKNAAKGGLVTEAMPGDEQIIAARHALDEIRRQIRQPRYQVNDVTIEKLGQILSENPFGIQLSLDEFAALLTSFRRSGRESDRAFYLSCYEGVDGGYVDRVGSGTLYIPLKIVSILGTIQPDVLLPYLQQYGGAGDGFMQRIQFFVWCDNLPLFDQEAQRQPIDSTVEQHAQKILDLTFDVTAAALQCVDANGHPRPLRYSPEAQAIFDAWENENAGEQRDERTSSAFRTHVGRQPATFAKLAAIFHVLEVLDSNWTLPTPALVGPAAAHLAADWCRYLAQHARKLWGEDTRVDVLDARAIVKLIHAGRIQNGTKVTAVRELLKSGKGDISAARVHAALAVLKACGAVNINVPPAGSKGGRPSQSLVLHPEIGTLAL